MLLSTMIMNLTNGALLSKTSIVAAVEIYRDRLISSKKKTIFYFLLDAFCFISLNV